MTIDFQLADAVEWATNYLPIAQARAEYWTAKEAQRQLELEI